MKHSGFTAHAWHVPLAAAALEEILPNGTTFYVALGTSFDLVAGTIEELTDSTYARKGHSSWSTATVGGAIHRRNSGAIVFDALTEGEKSVAAWAIFTAAEGGTMKAAGPVLNLAGEPEPFEVGAGDQPRFNSGELRLVGDPGVT